ncbi:hypothetical protein EV356DRAFT_169678 [Viridothelium virens]|uniref:Uncharacterized protein n=1 Tax=Viridothelium virens TaxID=1048519 RepID=A0A6A6HN68_VIRVR|nr:hypothetical protein EV356DRAFT_169678 [Viridothelium virens]
MKSYTKPDEDFPFYVLSCRGCLGSSGSNITAASDAMLDCLHRLHPRILGYAHLPGLRHLAAANLAELLLRNPLLFYRYPRLKIKFRRLSKTIRLTILMVAMCAFALPITLRYKCCRHRN